MESPRVREIEEELARLAGRRAALERELARLTEQTKRVPLATVEANVELFLRRFRCRETVYPRFWENKAKGTSGYSPVCANEWVRGVCGKPPNGRIKCAECPKQAFPSLDEAAAKTHLAGQATIGTYAIRENDACTFLACDFDGAAWREDAHLFRRMAATLGVEALVERSRSGEGAHVWIFFTEAIPARLARTLGTLILAKCGEVDHRLALQSFDRFFPSQDYLPKGGFGNLIALPFQGAAVQKGNTLFLDEALHPLPNQWEALASVKDLSRSDVERIVRSALPTSKRGHDEDFSMVTDANLVTRAIDLKGALPKGSAVRCERGMQLSIPLDGLPAGLVTALQRLASFANPEFYKLQRMRRATYPHPRFIFSGERRANELILRRGLLGKVEGVFARAGASLAVEDRRQKGAALTLTFSGKLTPRQQEAVRALLGFDEGILVAPPGSGKTVMACAVIAERNVSTLVLVHKQPLVDQWKNQITTLLAIDERQIGLYAGAKKKRTRRVDIAMLQSLVRSQDCAAILSEYGQVIVDECHHVPAASFEAVMKQCSAKYLLGLTATPKRKDSLEVLLYQQCGPIRDEIKIGEGHGVEKRATVRETGFGLPEEVGANPAYHVLAQLLATNTARNHLIAGDIAGALRRGRFPLVFADRKDQIKLLESALAEAAVETRASVFCFEGILSAKRRRDMLGAVASAKADGRPTVLMATASLIGEGFDLPDLDTLFLAAPISFEGRLVQYVGRLHRDAQGKTNVEVFDYVETACAVALKMCRGRLKTYQKMGYLVEMPGQLLRRGPSSQLNLFAS